MDPAFVSLAEVARQLAAKVVSPVDLTQLMLDRAAALQPRLNPFITLTPEAALEAARQAEREIVSGHYRGPLHGVPICLKDIVDTRGVRTTCGSKILADNVPTRDATVTERLVDAGAISIGKNNCSEFALGPTNENYHYGPARNPWDTERVSGGSSGGSAVAVAAGLAYAAIGTDTGGSIRIPASLCGLVGMKATYGRVSRAGVFPCSWTFDIIGPLTRTVEDAAIVLQAIAGYDRRDPASAGRPVPDFRADLERGVTGLRIGVPSNYFFDGLHPEVEAAARTAIEQLRQLGAAVEDLTLPHVELARDAHTTILLAEAANAHLTWLQTRPEDYCPDVRGRLETGALRLAVDLIQAQRVRALFQAEVAEAMARCDLLVTPGTPYPATPIGDSDKPINAIVGNVIFAMPRMTSVFSVTGLPAMTIPNGFTQSGLPIGLQLVGRAFDESTVLRAAHAYERAAGWYQRHPEVTDGFSDGATRLGRSKGV